MKVELLNVDCMEYMRTQPDGAFDLAVVDPPYGIGIAANPVRQLHKRKTWDATIPGAEYFSELERISKNRIIWGGNYFLDYLGATQCFLIWDKVQPHDFSLAMCEMAWSSFQQPAKLLKRSVMLEKGKIHPTQKPVQLYEWILRNHAKPGQRILDTHLGSGSSAIAAHYFGVDFVGCEIDEDYYRAAKARFDDATRQLALFGEEA